jgi:hypothetical protein
MLVLLAACSANGPDSANYAVPKAAARASVLAAAPDIHESVRQLTSRGPENVDIGPGPVPGSLVMRIHAGFSEVLLAKTNPDGTISTRCVDSPGGADTTPSAAPAKAAQ